MSFRTHLRDTIERAANPRHKFGHQPRLYTLSQQIGSGLSYDDDVVYAAIWLHDLGVFIGVRPEDPAALAQWDCVGYILDRAPAILAESGFPAAKIPAVVEVIRTHQSHSTPTTLEGSIVRDADILEQLGAVACMRTISKLDSDTRFHTFTSVRDALQKQLDTLPQKLQLPASHKLAEPRIRILSEFLAALAAETGADLY